MVDAGRPEPPIGRAMVRRPGTDVTVVTYGSLVSTAVAAAEEAQRQRGWSLEVIDLRSLVPLDFDTVAASIHRSGRCVVLHEGPRSLGYGAGLAARIQEEMFYELEAPVLRACGFDTPYPPARLEDCGCRARTGCWTASSVCWSSRERRQSDQVVSGPRPRRGLEEVTVTSWHVAVGDEVELNQTLCSVETAKAEVEIPSPYAGRIVETCGAEGDVLQVGAVLVRIDTAPASSEANGEAAVPTLVGYGTDAGIDASRRGRPLAALRCASWPRSFRLTSLRYGTFPRAG